MRLIKRSIWRVLCFTTGLTVGSFEAVGQCPPLPPNVDPAGYVLTVKGPWRLRSAPGAELETGCQLAPGVEIVPRDRFPIEDAKIAFLGASGELWVRTCNANMDCGPSLWVPRNPTSRPVWALLLDEIMRKLRDKPDRYVSVITLGDGKLNDAIVKQSASEIDLSPVMRGVAAGDYEMEFRRLEAVKLHWDGTNGSVGSAALATGLYEVRIKGQSSSDAWVLIIRSGPAANDALKRDTELRTVMSGWTDNADIEGRNGKRTLYRAFLAQVAERADAPGQ